MNGLENSPFIFTSAASKDKFYMMKTKNAFING